MTAALRHLAGMPIVKTPTDLCPAHATIWERWRDHRYNVRHPQDWPGQILQDSRTSHADRAATWARKNLEQMEATAAICRTGRSPQCDWLTTPKGS